jgi:hypothetical protein
LFGQEFLQSPLLDVLSLVVFELCDELDSTRENAAFVLFAARHNLRDFVDAFVDGFTAATLDCGDVLVLVRCLLATSLKPYLLCGCLCELCATRQIQRWAC